MSAVTDALVAKTVRGTRWVFAWRMATRLLGLVSTLFLVRLLAPADFGLVALATSISNSVEQFGWLGVEDAIVREVAPDREVYDTGFTINLLRSLLTGSCVAAAAWPAAHFFGDFRLFDIMLALAGATLLAGAENIGVVDFRRDFAFHREFTYLLLPRIISVVLAIGTAVLFRSYWALVVGIVSSRVLRVLSGYVMHPFRPRLSLRAWRRLAGYSLWMWLLGLAVLLRDRSDTLVIGRVLGSVQVGIYAVAFDLAALATTEIIEPLQRAAFSGFAAARKAGIQPREPLLRLLGTVTLVSLPATIGLSLVADPLLRLVIGSKWEGATALVQILGVAGSTIVAGYTCRAVLNSGAQLRTTFAITASCAVLRIGAMIILTMAVGLRGAALAAGGAMAIEGIVYLGITARRLEIGAGALLRPVWRPILATAGMALALWAGGLGWRAGGTATSLALMSDLFESAGAGAVVYAGLLLALWIASGRPAGAEADALGALGRMTLRLRAPRPAS